MTPAKLLALMDKRRDTWALFDGPFAQIAAILYNANRGMGDASKGIAPTTALRAEDLRVYRKRQKKATLAAKVIDPNLMGAVADKGAWSAYTESKAPNKKIKPRRPKK